MSHTSGDLLRDSCILLLERVLMGLRRTKGQDVHLDKYGVISDFIMKDESYGKSIRASSMKIWCACDNPPAIENEWLKYLWKYLKEVRQADYEKVKGSDLYPHWKVSIHDPSTRSKISSRSLIRQELHPVRLMRLRKLGRQRCLIHFSTVSMTSSTNVQCLRRLIHTL